MADSNYTKYVRSRLDAKSGMSYQKDVAIILEKYYLYKGYSFECPDAFGGDDKNDGWVPELGIFYQIYSPNNYNNSFGKNVYDKFEKDIEGLFEKVYSEKLWGGKINKFIYLVNTRDNLLPKDSDRRCEEVARKIEEKYSIEVKYTIKNSDYIEDLLFEITDDNLLHNILVRLGIDGAYKYSNITEYAIISFIDSVSDAINKSFTDSIEGSGYSRVSTDKKIDINNLNEKKEHIKNIVRKLDVVEMAVSAFNRRAPFNKKYDAIKEYIISEYEKLKNSYVGVDLYNKLLDELIKLTPESESYKLPAEFFLIYVFDKCDIFEKEIKE